MSNRGSSSVSVVILCMWEIILVTSQAWEWRSKAASLTACTSSCTAGCVLIRSSGPVFALVLGKFVGVSFPRFEGWYIGWGMLVAMTMRTRVPPRCGNHANVRAFRLGISVSTSGLCWIAFRTCLLYCVFGPFIGLVVILVFVVDFQSFRLFSFSL